MFKIDSFDAWELKEYEMLEHVRLNDYIRTYVTSVDLWNSKKKFKFMNCVYIRALTLTVEVVFAPSGILISVISGILQK